MDSDLQELLGNAGFGELDRAEFETKDEYEEYFKYITKAFKAFNTHLGKKLEESATKKVERTVISYFITRLLRSIELLNGKYQFDNTHSIRVDLTESSFPNHAELRQMKADYNLKDDFLAGLPNALVLKDRLISKLRTQNEEPLDALDNLAKRKYYSSLYPSSIYLMYNRGRLLETGKTNAGRPTFIYAWGTYDMALNRPQIFVMSVEYSGQEKAFENGNPDFEKFEDIVENISAGSQSIYEMVSFIDQELPNVHPKLIKKYDLGPLYGKYSKDESPYTKFYQRHGLSAKDYVFFYEEEIVASVNEGLVKASWISSKVPLQDFHIKTDDKECQKRKLSDVKKYLIAPHKVIQLLLDDPEMGLELMAVRNNMIAI
ncbi:MAG: hypothetical protein AB8B53_08320 [Flavobacteriales bacterium]